mgnify:CR=1 FL=1|jgi:tRNA-intron endonuclease
MKEVDLNEPEEEREVVDEPVTALFTEQSVLTENTNKARLLYEQSRYGNVLDNGQVQLSLHESLYLLQRGKLRVIDEDDNEYDVNSFIQRAKDNEPNFWIRYTVYKDIRRRGYILKTALKFGADFRIYDRGVKPGEDHAKWVVYPVHEGGTLTWYEFAAKNRVAHSTKKKLMLGVVDDEGDVTYWEVQWVRP